ncbi:helix-turn-helix domain-containing protein [Nocardia aurantia]|uniref:HTH cro/C1-type domain-containing protein n=1 Tax=Nocardia aurantia TaxID=2585199 RepID=A0A7K0DHP0_9NOCA|nr:helix-turn-helix transcriptional regulator [Nocardia aurantia]MQY25167.1 hypothetical protein [Nocardia aurantia]
MDQDRAIWDTRAVRVAAASGDYGAVVRAIRRANNLTLADLARHSNYSISTLSRLERGKQQLTDVRILRALAAALRIPPELLGLADPPPHLMQPSRPAAIVGVTRAPDEETEPMRRRTLLTGLAGTVTAIGVFPPPTAAGATTDPLPLLERALLAPPSHTSLVGLPSLGHQVAAARSMFDRGHYTELASGLPRLLSAATTTRATSTRSDDIAEADKLLAHAYVLTSRLSVKLSHDQLAWTAADRAVQAAHLSHDLPTRAIAHRSWAIVLRRSGFSDTATQLILDTAASLQPKLHQGAPYLAAYGALLCTAAYTAAADGDRDLAGTLIAEATNATTHINRDHPGHTTGFGLGSVGLYQVSIARVLGDCGAAIDAARRIDPATIPLAESRARYWSDVARAFHQWGKPEQCYRALRAAEQAAPDEVRYRKPIQKITAELLKHSEATTLPGLRSFAQRTGTRTR